MVFKTANGELTNVFKILNDRVTRLNSGINLTGNYVNSLVQQFDNLNSGQAFNDEWTVWLNNVRSQNSNVADMFEELSKQGASARASVEGVYAAILQGNTRGFANVRAVINTFKTLSPENQQAFAAAVGQTNAQLGNYLGTVNNGTASMKGYAASLVTAKAASIGLQVASTALNMGISAIVGFLLSKGLQAISDYIVTTEEALDLAEESAKAYDDQKDSLEKLKDEYIAIIDSEKNNAEKSRELKEWKEKLADAYDFERKALEKLNTERDEGIKLLDQEIDKANRRTRDIWLGENKNAVEEAIEHIETSKYGSTVDNFNFNVYDETYKTIFGSELRKYIQFYDAQAGIYEVAGENLLEKYENVQNAIAYLGSKTDLTDTEDELLSKLNEVNNKIEKELDKYKDTYETYYEFQSLNMFEDYSSENPMEENGKDTYLAWKDGLIKSANGDKEIERQLTELAKKKFGKLEEYFENWQKAQDLFSFHINSESDAKALEKRFDYLWKLSDEDLAIAVQIPDLFKNGLDGAADLIEEFKKNNPISVDTEGIQSLADIAEITSKKVSALKTAMAEMSDKGELTIGTYNSLVELGGNFADCITIQNGKIKVNTDRLKDLEKQSYDNSIAANELAIAELQLQAVSLKGVGTEWITEEITRLELENAALREAKTAIENAQPDDKDTGSGDGDSGNGDSEKPDSIVNFEKELAEKQHEINMGRMKEDAAYWDWYESAYKKAYEGQKDYQDDMYKHEEAVYNGRKKLAEDAFEAEQKAFKERITNYDAQIEVTTKDSTDFEGKKLDASERYDYIRSVYDDILSEINRRIGEIIESGIEGHEEEIKELEEMYEEYTDKRESTYDDEINHEISVLEKLKDKESDRFDEQIKKLEEQKDAVEDSYDAEIKKIDEKIKAIEDENDEQERLNDLEKTRQELEKSSQRTRKVYGSNGMVEYRQDDEAIAEAQKNYDNAKKDIEIAELEKQKEALETNKETEISKYDEMINAVNQQKDSQVQYWDYLIDILEAYLDPDSTETIDSVSERVLSDRENVKAEQAQTIVNGQAIDNPNGKAANANEINENINNAIKANTETAESNANAAKVNEESAKAKQQEETTSISPEEAEMKFAQTLGQFFMNGLLLANNGMTASSQFMNEQHGEAATAVNTNNAVNNYNNSPITNNTFTIGDIRITNPVGNSDDLAKELRMNIPISFQNQIYSNKKK